VSFQNASQATRVADPKTNRFEHQTFGAWLTGLDRDRGNGDRRAALVLQNKASVLREKDIMQPDEADTPAKRIYFPIMLMYLVEQGREKAYAEFASRLAEFMGAVRDPLVLAECIGVSKEVMGGEYYRALMRCRKLITYEAERLGLGHDVDTSLPARGHAG
jgi:flagellar protein FlbT